MQYNGRSIRHELKYEIDEERAFRLRQILSSLIVRDPNMKDPRGYLISSIYFDDYSNRALEEKLAGNCMRKKIRIRGYDMDDSLIRLECKEKYESFIAKESTLITRQEYDRILRGDYDCLRDRPERVCKSTFVLAKTRLLHPVVVVEYRREAYICREGNVRITFDKEIAASTGVMDFYDPACITNRVMRPGWMILEVKYDDYLPRVIQQAIGVVGAQQCSASKYVMCRDQKRKVQFI